MSYKSAEEIRRDRQDIAVLKSAHRDPEAFEAKVAAYRVYLMQKKAGRLPMYERVEK